MSLESMPTPGYGHAEWQKEEVTSEKALEELESLSDKDYTQLRNIILNDLGEGQIHAGAIDAHVRQVNQIGLKIAEESGQFKTREEMMLADLTILLHDIAKKPGNLMNLKTHAYGAAERVPDYLSNITNQNRPGGGDSRIEVSPTLQNFLKNSRATSNFIAKAVETHSSIPFIDNVENILPPALGDQFKDYKWINTLRDDIIQNKKPDELPYLVDRGDGSFGLPTPFDKYSALLRAADTLSNYGIIPDLESNSVDPLDRYSGFMKIVRLDSGKTVNDKLSNIIGHAINAIDAGLYKDFPVAQDAAKTSVDYMRYLQIHFSEHGEPNNPEEMKESFTAAFHDLEKSVRDKKIAASEY